MDHKLHGPDISQIVQDLLHGSHAIKSSRPPSHSKPLDSKMSALKELYRLLVQDKLVTTKDLKLSLEDLFRGLSSCLQTAHLQKLSQEQGSEQSSVSELIVEVILKANQILFEIMPDIQQLEPLEVQMAQLISIFIENLGSPKSIVRKSTHKCIGTYVKLTKKLEFVLLHIMRTGLENPNSRTRQHSMLVIPALLSLKTQIIESECSEMKELVQAVMKRIKADSSEIVAKTGKKLILELQKCYPAHFKRNYIDSLRSNDDQLICQAVLNNDDAGLKKLLVQAQQQAVVSHNKPVISPGLPTHKDMSRVGQEIIGGKLPVSSKQPSTEEHKEVTGAKPLTFKDQGLSHPRAQNGLLYSFLKDEIVNSLEEDKQWKDRVASIETIEAELHLVLQRSERKMEFIPFSTAFLGFLIQFIKDINFKICLAAIQMANKLLVLSIANVKKHYTSLVTVLIEKLSDSKVVIRQAVLKCCGLIIKGYQPTLFVNHAIRYMQHTNWHVREGILHLIANCLIAQNQIDEINASSGKLDKDSISFHDSNNLAQSPSLISELSQVAKVESKQKIQQMAIDCLALCLDICQDQKKTEQIIMRELGLHESHFPDTSSLGTNDTFIIKQIKERLTKDCLPAMQIDGSIEFRPMDSFTQPPGQFSGQSAPQGQQDESSHVLDAPRPPVHLSLQGSFQKVNAVSLPASEQKPPSEGVKLQMRFQQDRIQNNQSQQIPVMGQRNQLKTPQKIEAAQQQKTPDVGNSKRYQHVENNLIASNNREQFSLSTINHSGIPKQGPTPSKQHNLKKIPESSEPHPLPELTILQKKDNPQKSTTRNITGKHDSLEELGRGLRQKNETVGDASVDREFEPDSKISMWLPSFKRDHKSNHAPSPLPGALGRNSLNSLNAVGQERREEGKAEVSPYVQPADKEGLQLKSLKQRVASMNQPSQANPPVGGYPNSSSAKPKNEPVKLQNLNATASSQATVLNDGKITQTTLMSSNNNPSNRGIKPATSNILVSDGASPMNNKRNPLTKPFSTNNERKKLDTEGYTPQVHSNKPRHTGGFMSISDASHRGQLVTKTNNNLDAQSSKTNLQGEHNTNFNDIKPIFTDIQLSQSSGAPGGFGVHKNEINERLQLLKSTFKYKNVPSEFENQSQEAGTFDQRLKYQDEHKAISEHNPKQFPSKKPALPNNYMMPAKSTEKPQQTHNSFGISNVSTNANNNLSSAIVHNEYSNLQKDQISIRTRKPPKGGFGGSNAYPVQPLHQGSGFRANSASDNEEFPLQLNAYPKSDVGPISNTATTYNAVEEPLKTPEPLFKQSVQNLSSDDWQKVFEAMNILKRVAMFHKQLMSSQNSGQVYKDCIKGVVKQTDNLRSQVAKNACMALQVIYTELPTKELDPHIDMVLSALIKKATDTNHFVSEQAEKALAMVCNACTDTKVLNSLQQINGRGNNIKQKVCACYCNLIAKMGPKLKTFKECERLVKAVVLMLGEGALEVRNQAKLAILTIKNNFPNHRDFEGLLHRCNLTDRQFEQVKKVVEQNDYESLSNFANTRYGGSMRGSSLDSRSAATEIQRRTPNAIPRNQAAGSDGFNQSLFSDGKMQATFLSGGGLPQNIGSSNGFGMTGGSSQQAAFKKRQPSVAKPVDPQLMEEFKELVNACNTSDWGKRLQALERLNSWVVAHSITIKQTQAAKFIQLLDIECKLIQDNNVKVQQAALQGFSAFLNNPNLRQLIDQNLTMIVQALAHNLASSSPATRNATEELFVLLEVTTENPSQIIQPIVAQINLSNNRSKPQLVEILASLLQRKKQIFQQYPSMMDRYVQPLLRPTNKVQQEAQLNARLKEAIKTLEQAVAHLA